MAARDCIAAIKAAGKGLLRQEDIEELVERVQKHIDRTRAEGRAARAASSETAAWADSPKAQRPTCRAQTLSARARSGPKSCSW